MQNRSLVNDAEQLQVRRRVIGRKMSGLAAGSESGAARSDAVGGPNVGSIGVQIFQIRRPASLVVVSDQLGVQVVDGQCGGFVAFVRVVGQFGRRKRRPESHSRRIGVG
jgi:hypothetical protein